ncbi:MAG: hypothetical protein J6X11_12865 [Treponema sp.]|nr:hypothetical protein [Treponema sp.]MBR6144584.1 hypothetical protein [Treponema sp.]
MQNKETFTGSIEQFCKYGMKCLENESNSQFSISGVFETHVYKNGSPNEIGTYKSYVCKNSDGKSVLNLHIYKEGVGCSKKIFHIEECMIIKSESSKTQITFEDEDKSVWIVKHC